MWAKQDGRNVSANGRTWTFASIDEAIKFAVAYNDAREKFLVSSTTSGGWSGNGDNAPSWYGTNYKTASSKAAENDNRWPLVERLLAPLSNADLSDRVDRALATRWGGSSGEWRDLVYSMVSERRVKLFQDLSPTVQSLFSAGDLEIIANP